MRGIKFEKSHIHLLESETLSRLSRVTESAQEIVDSIPYISEHYTYVYHMSTLNTFGEEVYFTIIWDFTWSVSDCEKLGGVSHRR